MAELVDGCDAVYHLAAAVGVKLIVDSPVRTIETNFDNLCLLEQHPRRVKFRLSEGQTPRRHDATGGEGGRLRTPGPLASWCRGVSSSSGCGLTRQRGRRLPSPPAPATMRRRR